MNSETPREAIAKAMYEDCPVVIASRAPSGSDDVLDWERMQEWNRPQWEFYEERYGSDDPRSYPMAETYRDTADAVITHIWQRAESPEVVEAVRDRIKSIANDPHIKDRYQMYAEVVLEAVLTELIGPKPEETSHE